MQSDSKFVNNQHHHDAKALDAGSGDVEITDGGLLR